MTLGGVVDFILGIFNVILPVLAALALVLFFIGVIRYIRHAGKKNDRTIMLWSLIALFVMFSFWGILRLMTNTLLGSSGGGGGDNNEYFHTIDDNAGI